MVLEYSSELRMSQHKMLQSSMINSTMKLDTIDLRILDELQRDGALTNVELARRVHLSPSPCLARVKALEAAGVIDALCGPGQCGRAWAWA